MSCPYKFNVTHGMNNFQGSLDRLPSVESTNFQTSFTQQEKLPLQNAIQSSASFNASVVGLPEDGQKTISSLMSFYDNALQQNKNSDSIENNNQNMQVQMDGSFCGSNSMFGNSTPHGMNLNEVKDHNQGFFGQRASLNGVFQGNKLNIEEADRSQHQKFHQGMNNGFSNHPAMLGNPTTSLGTDINFKEQSIMQANNNMASCVFANQLDNSSRAFDPSPFGMNLNDNIAEFGYAVPYNLSTMDFEQLSRQDNPIWNL